MTNNVFVTGSGGYVGKDFLKELKKRKDIGIIYCLVRRSFSDTSNVKYILGDLTSPETYKKYLLKCETVYHLAGYVRHEVSARNKLYLSNYIGTKTIIDASVRAGIKNFVYLGSAGVFHSNECVLCTENTPHTSKHSNYYCYTKYLAHQYIKSAIDKGLAVTTIMPVSIYSNDSQMFTELIDFLYNKKVFFKSLMDKNILLVSKENVIKALINYDKLEPDFGGYLIVDDSIIVADLIAAIKKELSIKVRIIFLPYMLLSLYLYLVSFFTFITGRELYANIENYNFLNGKLNVECSKINNYLSFDKGYFRKSLKKMLISFKIKQARGGYKGAEKKLSHI
jgi:nucleoside-diphosphate-sugar epimerase